MKPYHILLTKRNNSSNIFIEREKDKEQDKRKENCNDNNKKT